MKFRFMASACVVAMMATTANAAVVTESFNFHDSILNNGGSYAAITFTGTRGSRVTVTAYYYTSFPDMPSDTLTAVRPWGQEGLGAGHEVERPGNAVDGSRRNEALYLDFGKEVAVQSVDFGWNSDLSKFQIGSVGTGLRSVHMDVANNVDVSGKNGTIGNVIGIGAWQDDSAFTVKGVTITYDVPDNAPPPPSVPLPAAGWMLLAGLGGLAAARKRKAH